MRYGYHKTQNSMLSSNPPKKCTKVHPKEVKGRKLWHTVKKVKNSISLIFLLHFLKNTNFLDHTTFANLAGRAKLLKSLYPDDQCTLD
jgi:hypothetical protein